MLKLENGLLINEYQIVAAEFIKQDKTLKVTFSAPVTFGERVADNPYQVLFSGYEAEEIMRILSKGAQSVLSKPRVSSGPSVAVGGKRGGPNFL
jgi:hypothetical protein